MVHLLRPAPRAGRRRAPRRRGRWRDELTARELASATIRRKLAAVSSFYGYWAEGAAGTEPGEERGAASRERWEPTSITADQGAGRAAARVRRRPSGPPAGPAPRRPDPRPAVIVRLLAETGMRVSELCGARVEDLAMTGGHHVLTVTRKGGNSSSCRSRNDPAPHRRLPRRAAGRGGSSARSAPTRSASRAASWPASTCVTCCAAL